MPIRRYIVEDDDTLRRVSGRVMEGLLYQNDAIPGYASRTVRSIEILLETEDRKPVKILRLIGGYLRFDEDGKLDVMELRKEAVAALHLDDGVVESDGGTIVDVTAKIEANKQREKWRWDPSQDVINTIINDIWPETTGKRVKRAAYVRGTAKKKPPVTYEAQRALRDIDPAISEIERSFYRLGPRDLEGLIGEAYERATYSTERIRARIYRGVASAAEYALEVDRAWRKDKGVWFAIAELYRRRPDEPGVFSMTELDAVACNSKADAIGKGRELLRKHADEFAEGHNVEVRICPEVERGAAPLR